MRLAEVTKPWAVASRIYCSSKISEVHEHGLRNSLISGTRFLLNQRAEIAAIRRDSSEFAVESLVAPYQVGGHGPQWLRPRHHRTEWAETSLDEREGPLRAIM
jgi:hypothetical protein